MQYVNVGQRFVAFLIDAVISSLVGFILLASTIGVGSSSDSSIPGLILALLLWIGYFTLFEGLVGATPGKLVVGIRVVKQDGSRLDLGSALLRTLLRIVDGFPYVIPYLVGAFAVWNSPMHQRIGDRVARSVVIQTETSRARAARPIPRQIQVIGLTYMALSAAVTIWHWARGESASVSVGLFKAGLVVLLVGTYLDWRRRHHDKANGSEA